jgi:hypothetical protein
VVQAGLIMHVARVAEVVWYATGRFYSTIPESNQQSQLLDVGYFLHIQGIAAPIFDGPISEHTARFTFAAEPFTAPTITNGDLNIGIDRTGAFSLYVRESGGATFDDPASFAVGTCIGTFERIAIVPTVKVGINASETLLTNVFTARLVSSVPFELAGRQYDLRDLVGFGITQWGTAATEPIQPPPGYSSAVPFVGSAVRVG